MDNTIKDAKEEGYVRTLFGRKIHTPNINSKAPSAGFAKRSAINAPIQGTAADIIKLAMIKIPKLLINNNLKKAFNFKGVNIVINLKKTLNPFTNQ